MIATWMTYLLIISTLLGAAALAGEQLLSRLRLPARWAWSVSILLIFALPWIARWLPPVKVLPEGVGIELGPMQVVALSGLGISNGTVREAGDAAPWLLGLWLTLSIIAALTVGLSLRTVHQQSGQWKRRDIGGTEVSISESLGPAVVGFFRPQIIIPRWSLELREAELRMLLRHEREHIRAGDPLLHLFGLIAAVLLPWNLPLLWQLRRLRNAIEVDCDARVLVADASVQDYGALLLKAAGRGGSPLMAAVAFTTRESQLERRMKMMMERNSRQSTLVRVGAGFAAIALLLVACGIDQPTGLTTNRNTVLQADVSAAQLAAEPTFTPFETRPELADRRAWAMRIMELYPVELREAGTGGNVLLWLFVQEDGTVGASRVVESSGYPALDAAAMEAVEAASFTPAENNGVPVPVWIQVPITFQPPAA